MIPKRTLKDLPPGARGLPYRSWMANLPRDAFLMSPAEIELARKPVEIAPWDKSLRHK